MTSASTKSEEWHSTWQTNSHPEAAWATETVLITWEPGRAAFESRGNSLKYDWIGEAEVKDKEYLAGTWESVREASSGTFILHRSQEQTLRGFFLGPNKRGKRNYGMWVLAKDAAGLAPEKTNLANMCPGIEGWTLRTTGRAAALRKVLARLTAPATNSFVLEAIRCCELELHRAAVVLAWSGALAVLYDQVVQHHLADFNARAITGKHLARPAKNAGDLSVIGDSDFLTVLRQISFLSKNEQQELQRCLDLRNACGHASPLVVGEHLALAHLEVLMLNVFEKYGGAKP